MAPDAVFATTSQHQADLGFDEDVDSVGAARLGGVHRLASNLGNGFGHVSPGKTEPPDPHQSKRYGPIVELTPATGFLIALFQQPSAGILLSESTKPGKEHGEFSP